MSRIFLLTQGCSLNQSDSETMIGVLLESGHEIVENEEEADVLIVNSCTVKSNPEQRLFSLIRKTKKPFIVAGCVPKADPENIHFAHLSLIGPKSLSLIARAVEETLAGKTVRYLDDALEERLSLPLKRARPHIAIIPINAGCLSNCSYCKTKHARGDLQSYPIDQIEKRFREAVNAGAKEVWLTSQGTGAYGLDSGTDIVSLLQRLLEKPGDYRIRLGMSNPQYLLPRIERFIGVLKHPNMFRFLHLPVQSGSDRVLKLMRRGHSVKQYREMVMRLKEAVPDLTIATDLIVGFPTETENECDGSIALIEDLDIPVVNLSKFYPRPGTLAAGMKLLKTDIVKARSTRVKKACEKIAAKRNASFIGKELSVIIDEPGKVEGTVIARADNYVQVIVPQTTGRIGDRITITPAKSGISDVRV